MSLITILRRKLRHNRRLPALSDHVRRDIGLDVVDRRAWSKHDHHIGFTAR